MSWLNDTARFLGDFAGAFAMAAFLTWQINRSKREVMKKQEHITKTVEAIDQAVNHRAQIDPTISEEVADIADEQIRVSQELKDKEAQ